MIHTAAGKIRALKVDILKSHLIKREIPYIGKRPIAAVYLCNTVLSMSKKAEPVILQLSNIVENRLHIRNTQLSMAQKRNSAAPILHPEKVQRVNVQ